MKVSVLVMTVFVASLVASQLYHEDSPSMEEEEIIDTSDETALEQEDPGFNDSPSMEEEEIIDTSDEMAFEQEDPGFNDSPLMEEEEIIDTSDEMAFEQEDPGNNAPVKTEGGNANGANCVFPFVYLGVTYNRCTNKNNDKLWCATTNDYREDGKWGNCVGQAPVKTEGGNANGANCFFPFVYLGVTYNRCTNKNNDKLWCATTNDYREDGKWGNCVGQGPSFYMSDRGDCKTPSKFECKNIAATGQAPNVYKGEVLTTSKTQHRPLGCYYHKDKGYYYNVRNAPGVTRGCRVDYQCVCKS